MSTSTESFPRGRLERSYRSQGQILVGVDEVGRGCLAGPVYAASVILDFNLLAKRPKRERDLIRDSKTLSSAQRQRILGCLDMIVVDRAVALAEVTEIEEHGIVGATFLAMRRALQALSHPFDLVLVDGKARIPDLSWRQETIIGGDRLCFSIAAASIYAKEARDAFMRGQATEFPAYGFERHVGYGTKEHLDAIRSHGVCPLHRRNFSPISSALSSPLPI